MKNFDKVLVSFGVFYVLGIIANSVIIELIYGCDTTELAIWSKNGAGHVFATIAGLSALISRKVYNWMKKENE